MPATGQLSLELSDNARRNGGGRNPFRMRPSMAGRRRLRSHWLLAETERVSVLLLPFFCSCCSCHNCSGRLLVASVLLAAAVVRVALLLPPVMNAVAQQHLFTWETAGQRQVADDEAEDGTFVHTAVHAKDDVLQLFYVPEEESAKNRGYLETIEESSDDDEDYSTCAWTDSDRGTVVEVPLDTDETEDETDSSDSTTSSTEEEEEEEEAVEKLADENFRSELKSCGSPVSSHNNGCLHGNAQPQWWRVAAESKDKADSLGEAKAARLENVMFSRGSEDADFRLVRLMQRNSARETRLWLRANFAHRLAPSAAEKKKEERSGQTPARRQSSPDVGGSGRKRPGPRRASWPPEAGMQQQQQPICVRVTATEIMASSPCFALKLTPPPPRRRTHTTGERPSILKTPSPTQLSYQTISPTPPPRRRHTSGQVTMPPLVAATLLDTPLTSPDVSSDLAVSPDVSLDTWPTPEMSIDLVSSPDVSMDVPMSPDTSTDTFHAVPCFLLPFSSEEEHHSVPECRPSDHSSSRKPPLPPVRTQTASAKLTTGVKSRIASARRQYLDAQQASQSQPTSSTKVLQDRFQQFCADTQVERSRLVVSVPDLLEQMRRSPSPCAPIDRLHGETPSSQLSYRLQHPPVRPWPVPPAPAPGHISKSLGLLETDLDCEEPLTREVTNLDAFLNRTSSLMALRESRTSAEDRARSMDFLLDEDNRACAMPPENALTGRVKSEHEIRVERSLQNLTLPDWYKRKPQEGFILKRDRQQQQGNESGPGRPSSQPLRWTGLGSRTPSSSSLAPGSVVIPKRINRPDWRYVSSLRSSRESLQSSTASPDSTSSSPFFSWSAYKTNRTQPYLGWRYAASVTNSAAPSPSPASSTPLSGSRPVSPGRWWQPGDRLPLSLYQPPPQQQQQEASDLKNDPGNFRTTMSRDRFSYIQSIYNGDAPKFTSTNSPAKTTPSRSPVSRSEDDQKDEEDEEEKSSSSVFWMESSFVGSRSTTSVVVLPDDEPEEPEQPVRNGDHQPYQKRGSKGNCSGDVSRSSTSERLGDSATSMEEVLDSLLAIPGSSRSSSPLLSRHTSPVPATASSPSPSPSPSPASAQTVLPPAGPVHPPPPQVSERTVKFREPERDSSQLPSPYDYEDDEEQLPPPPPELLLRDSPDPDEEERVMPPAPPDTEASPSGEAPPVVPEAAQEEQDQPQPKSPARMSGVRNAGIIRCRRPNCKRSLPAEEARAKFRTCSNCYTYYCSRHCRKAHWERHKAQCPQTRVANLCTQVLMKVREDPRSRRSLSVCARRGFLSRGRGVVKLVFLSAEDALDYLCNGRDSVKGQTFYVPRCDIMPQEMGHDVFGQVRVFCEKYNPDRKFILLVAISVMSTDGLEREVVVRGVKMRLATPLSEDEVQTLICTVTKDPPADGEIGPGEQELRQGYDAIEAQLEERGVRLKDQYPDAYGKLIAFVERREAFVPLNIFPTDNRTGKMFMCILLPWADDDIIKMISSKTTVVRSKRRWIL